MENWGLIVLREENLLIDWSPDNGKDPTPTPTPTSNPSPTSNPRPTLTLTLTLTGLTFARTPN